MDKPHTEASGSLCTYCTSLAHTPWETLFFTVKLIQRSESHKEDGARCWHPKLATWHTLNKYRVWWGHVMKPLLIFFLLFFCDTLKSLLESVPWPPSPRFCIHLFLITLKAEAADWPLLNFPSKNSYTVVLLTEAMLLLLLCTGVCVQLHLHVVLTDQSGVFPQGLSFETSLFTGLRLAK